MVKTSAYKRALTFGLKRIKIKHLKLNGYGPLSHVGWVSNQPYRYPQVKADFFMKQNITVEQLSELSSKGKATLSDYCNKNGIFIWKPSGDCAMGKFPCDIDHLPRLFIGEMIEFLDEHKEGWAIMRPYKSDPEQRIVLSYLNYLHRNTELCDGLWETVKEILNG